MVRFSLTSKRTAGGLAVSCSVSTQHEGIEIVEIYEGGCLCGAVRYRVVGTPIEALICHCTFCQRRTGSAFGISTYCNEKDVEITRGVLKTYEYCSDESQRWLKMEFCPICGTSVTWTIEELPGARAVAGGTLFSTTI
jgi:hypothetical protein